MRTVNVNGEPMILKSNARVGSIRKGRGNGQGKY